MTQWISVTKRDHHQQSKHSLYSYSEPGAKQVHQSTSQELSETGTIFIPILKGRLCGWRITWFAHDQTSASIRIQVCLILEHQPSPPDNTGSEDGRKGHLGGKVVCSAPGQLGSLSDRHVITRRCRKSGCSIRQRTGERGVTTHTWWRKPSD